MDWEKIIQEKPLSALSPEERLAMEAEMSPEDYDSLHETWQATQKYFRATAPKLEANPQIRQQIRAHMRELENEDLGAKVRRLLARRVPAYQAVAAALALMAMVHFGGNLIKPQGGSFDQQSGFIADTTHQDTSHRVGYNLYEDSALSKFMIEAL
ncbi:MAG: hypothetical protein AAF927_29060 [Bacteroidota bacterium]